MNQNNPGQPPTSPLQGLAFYASAAHDCGYLPDRSSVTLFADPDADMTMENFSALLKVGFRRSGAYVYRPHCPTCHACTAARIPVEDFQPNRTQKRSLRRNAHPNALKDTPQQIIATVMEPAMRKEQFALYRKYLSTRHTGGGMDDPSPNRYMEFLTSNWTQTEFVEFRLDEKLVAVAVMDVLSHGLSSVYTFFDPDHSKLSLGRHALLWQINEARRRKLPHLYLGYWIKNCQKMLYKQEYRPIELYLNGHWHHFERNQELPDPPDIETPQTPRSL